MTLKQMKGQIKRLKRIASIDFDEKRFEEAAERHKARLLCLNYDAIQGLFDELGEIPKLKKVETDDEKFIESCLVYRERNKQ